MTELALFPKQKPINKDTVRYVVHQFLLARVGQEIDGVTLEIIDPRHPKSGDRIMRYLRTERWCYVPCVCRAKSLYYVEWVERLDKGTVEKALLTAEEFTNQRIEAGYDYYHLEP